MSEFNNVTIVKKANQYFDGKVTSQNCHLRRWHKRRWGLCFRVSIAGTEAKELMEILAGTLTIQLPEKRACNLGGSLLRFRKLEF